ncbi:MAG: D-aminoacyl-tRNA deacylase [Veillonellaceae bacterium]|nr:D-aminoacyl-tRNA deacylase [Veillonellaceae bacterium]
MRAVLQRTLRSQVTVDGEVVGRIGAGLTVLLGVGPEDTATDVQYMKDKILHLRIFEDDAGKMNRSLLDTAGELLIVSQFTLYGDCRKGRRPGFSSAAPPELAKRLYEELAAACRAEGVTVATGIFAAEMQVELVNDGPVTMLLDSRKLF